MDSNIKNIVEIVLEVSKQVQAKYDLELELVNDELAEANAEIERLQAKVEAMELLGDFEAIQADIDKLTEQKDRQAKTIQELMEKLEAAEKRAGNAILESADAGDRQKQKEEIRRLEELTEKLRAENNELERKLNSAMDYIDRQAVSAEKIQAGAKDPRWIPISTKQPEMGMDILACTKRGVVDIARMAEDGWRRNGSKSMAEPIAWMPLPVKYEEE